MMFSVEFSLNIPAEYAIINYKLEVLLITMWTGQFGG